LADVKRRATNFDTVSMICCVTLSSFFVYNVNINRERREAMLLYLGWIVAAFLAGVLLTLFG
jgi:hypothetical protein